MPSGSSDAFAPPWSAHAIDARLFNLDDSHVVVTFIRSCHSRQPCHFGVSQLQLTATPTPDGGLAQLRAWAYPTYRSAHAWAQGRNQALFAAPRTLMVSPWPGVIASFGEHVFRRQHLRCAPWAVAGARRRFVPPRVRKQNRAQCGSSPAGAELELEVMGERTARFGRLSLLHNHSARLLKGIAHAAGRRSHTTNLIRVRFRSSRGTQCVALLGVGHIHRSDGVRNGGASPPFFFGADYDHFFFASSPVPPFEPLAVSRDFCLGAANKNGRADCERVQFVSGLAIERRRGNASTWGLADSEEPALLLSYGANDCEARVARIAVERVWRMLTPLPGVAQACVNEI